MKIKWHICVNQVTYLSHIYKRFTISVIVLCIYIYLVEYLFTIYSQLLLSHIYHNVVALIINKSVLNYCKCYITFP